MTLGNKLAVFAATVAMIGTGTLAATTQASAAPLIATPAVVADNGDWHQDGGDRGYQDRGRGYGDNHGDRDWRGDRGRDQYGDRGWDRGRDRHGDWDRGRDWHRDRGDHDGGFYLRIGG